MKNPTDDDAYDALFRSYEAANKRIKELDSQLADEQERNANNVANADLQIAELKAEVVRLDADLVIEKDGHICNLGIADLQIAELSDEIEDYKKQLAAAQAEVTRLRAGGCARDQHTTQYCGEMVAASERIAELESRIAEIEGYVRSSCLSTEIVMRISDRLRVWKQEEVK